MRVLCPYCDSYVEADEFMRCPNCGGALSDAVLAAEEKQKQEESRQKEEAEALERKRQEDERDEKIFNVVLGILGMAGGSGGRLRRRTLFGWIRNLIRRFG